MAPFMNLNNIGFSYGSETALRGVDFMLAKGGITGITGPNGSGKSTLLRIMSGLLQPGCGSAELLGRSVFSYTKSELARLLAYVPSELYVPYDFSVLETVLMGRSPYVSWYGNYSPADSAVAVETLRKVGIERLKGRSINSLSSGERQLAFIAQALAQKPAVLLLDEPTSHLDINFRIQIFELLAQLASDKMAVVLVSHDLSALSVYAEQVLILKDGTPVFFGPAKEGLTGKGIASAYRITDPASVSRLLNI